MQPDCLHHKLQYKNKLVLLGLSQLVVAILSVQIINFIVHVAQAVVLLHMLR